MYYVDEDGQHTGFENVFAKIDMRATHYEEVGMGRDFVTQFVRRGIMRRAARCPSP
jgi:hypothetical protein